MLAIAQARYQQVPVLRPVAPHPAAEVAEGVGVVDEGHGIDPIPIAPEDNTPLFSARQWKPGSDGGCSSGIARADLDEFGHGAYGAKNITHVNQDTADQAALLSLKPQQWLREQAISHTVKADTVVGFGIAVGVLPLAVMAMKAGKEETSEALHVHKELTTVRDRIGAHLTALDQPLAEDSPPELSDAQSHAKKIETESLAQINSALAHNFYNGGIGVNSFVSGGAIFTKVAGETALKAVSLAVAESAGLTTATTAMAIAGTVVLGPVAGLAAVGLGGFFVYQARKVAKELAEDRQLIAASTVTRTEAQIDIERPYQTFIDRKFTSREKFSAHFKRWNSGFLTGSCLYAASAVAKGVIGVAAIAGAAAFFASPPGLMVLLALGIAGGVMMAACSWQFLVSHDKSKKHQGYRIQESIFLGRRFDALQTVSSVVARNAGETRSAATLRSALYDFVTVRDSTRQQFLQAQASQHKKFRAWQKRATETVPEEMVASKQRQRSKNVLANFYYIGTYLRERIDGKPHASAKSAALQVHARHADDLTVTDLTNWLNENTTAPPKTRGLPELRRLIFKMLCDQVEFLQEKKAAFEEFSHQFLTPGELEPAVAQTFSNAKEEASTDAIRERRIKALLANSDLVPIDQLKKEFLKLQGLEPADLPSSDNVPALNERLAHYLMEDMTAELTATRGILFDMHRRSFHLQKAIQPTQQHRAAQAAPE